MATEDRLPAEILKGNTVVPIEQLVSTSPLKHWRIAINDLINFGTTLAPENHASSTKIYGIGKKEYFGHLKLVDELSTSYDISYGAAITPKAVKDITDLRLPVNAILDKTNVNSIDGSLLFGDVVVNKITANVFDGIITNSETSKYALYDKNGNDITEFYSTKKELNECLKPLRRDGEGIQWNGIKDPSNASKCIIYQNNYVGYMPALNLAANDGDRVGFGTHNNKCSWTYFSQENTTNVADASIDLIPTGIQINGNLDVSNNLDVNDKLKVQGQTNLLSSLDVQGETNLLSSLEVQGATNITSSLEVGGTTNLMSSLDVQGATNLLSSLDVQGSTTLTTLTANDTSLSSLKVSGITNLLSSLEVQGKTNLLSTLDVQGATTLTTLNANDTSLSSLEVSGTTNMKSSLDVKGETTLTTLNASDTSLSSLEVSGATNLSSSLEVQGATNLLSSLEVGGTTNLTTLNANDTSLSSLKVSGTTNITSLKVDGLLTVSANLKNDGSSISSPEGNTINDLGRALTVDGRCIIEDSCIVRNVLHITDMEDNVPGKSVAMRMKTNGDNGKFGIYVFDFAKKGGEDNADEWGTSAPISFDIERTTCKYDPTKEVAGKTTIGGDLHAIGSISAEGKVYNAIWNDYAEFFEKGEETEVGDIIALDLFSDEERYVKASKENSTIVGVHSDTYGHILGGAESIENSEESFIPVGLVGRVKTKIVGEIKKGEFVVISNIPGVGCAYDKKLNTPLDVFGVAVESSDDIDIKLVKIKLK